ARHPRIDAPGEAAARIAGRGSLDRSRALTARLRRALALFPLAPQAVTDQGEFPMKPTWIVVANAFQAQLYEHAKPRDPLQPVESFGPPEIRLESSELNAAQPGSTLTQGGGHPAYSPAVEMKDNEQEEFARHIVDRLQQGVHGDRCGALMLFASP